MKRLIFGIFSVLYILPAMALTVSGTVVDDLGPMPDVNVYQADNTINGGTTDLDGKFEIISIPDGANVQISYVGYKTQTLPAKTDMGTIVLERDTQVLKEVEIVAERICDSANELEKLHAKKAEKYKIDNKNAECRPIDCICGYDLDTSEKKYKCIPWSDDKECTPGDKNAATGHPTCENGKEVCIIDTCKLGYRPNNNKCEKIQCPCGQELDEKTDTCVAWKSDKKCSKLPKHAKSGKLTCRDGIEICEIIDCDGVEYKHDTENNQCIKTTGDECKANDKNAKKAKLEKRNNKMVCVIKQCNKGYTPSDDGTKCEQSEGDCSDQVSKIDPNATKGELKKKKCNITECKNGYNIDNNKCVPISGNCKKLPENATRGSITFDEVTQSEICLVSNCKTGYKPSEDKKSCIVDEEEQNMMAELRDNYEKMKENEQSTANRALGATSMATMGLGAMQATSAKAELNVYEDAERDMAAYLATFRCDFGTGKKYKGGEKNVQIPGANELIPLYTEYVNLANDLKLRKEQLGLKPGIESEKILDSATTGLYDDVSTGITSGAYASLSRALMNPDGEDAKKWAAMKGASQEQLKKGLTAVGIGAVVGIAGNKIINAKAPKESSKEILKKYSKVKTIFEDAKKDQPAAECSDIDGATGTYPNCTCLDSKKRYKGEQGCIPCDGDLIYDTQDQCVCPNGMVQIQNSTKCEKPTPIQPTPEKPEPEPEECKLTGLRMQNECKCIDNASAISNVCKCNSEYESVDGKCILQKPSCRLTGLANQETCQCIENARENGTICVCGDGYIEQAGKCIAIQPDPEPVVPLFKAEFNTDAMFDSGKSTLKDNGRKFLTDFQSKLDTALKDAQSENPDINFDLANGNDYCIVITGHTDRSKFKNDKHDEKNYKLSEDRAIAVKKILTSGKNIPENAITTSGKGPSECQPEIYRNYKDPKCRRVDVRFWAGSCQSVTTQLLDGALEALKNNSL